MNKQMVLGVFADNTSASNALNDLQAKGYDPKNISVITRDSNNTTQVVNDSGADVIDNTAQGAGQGAATGAVVGGIAGLLIGVGAIAIPGIGGLLVGGPIAAALGLTGAAATTMTGALTGGLAGGLIGALVGLGVPEEQAEVYEERLKQGAILLIVPAVSDNDMTAREILQQNGADQISIVNTPNNS